MKSPNPTPDAIAAAEAKADASEQRASKAKKELKLAKAHYKSAKKAMKQARKASRKAAKLARKARRRLAELQEGMAVPGNAKKSGKGGAKTKTGSDSTQSRPAPVRGKR